MTSFVPAVDLSNLAEARMVRVLSARDYPEIVMAQWATKTPLTALTEDVALRLVSSQTGLEEVVLEREDTVAYLRRSTNTTRVAVAGRTREVAERHLQFLRAALPGLESEPSKVPASFWWYEAYANSSSRHIPTLAWDDIAGNYVGDAHDDLEDMVGWDQPPTGGRLIVWHGNPGTGKTNAIRLLAGAWREWASFHFITDPEEFLRRPGYLSEVATSDDIDETFNSENLTGKDRWNVIVLEDTGEILTPDAKVAEGQAVSRLLNICDGILGEAMKALVIVTANEPVRRMPSALTRPGRMLRSTEFRPFTPAEAAAWLTDMDAERELPDADRDTTLAELYAIAGGREDTILQPPPKVGFTV